MKWKIITKNPQHKFTWYQVNIIWFFLRQKESVDNKEIFQYIFDYYKVLYSSSATENEKKKLTNSYLLISSITVEIINVSEQ